MIEDTWDHTFWGGYVASSESERNGTCGIETESGRPGAGTYVRVRGLVTWAALMQSVALSGLLAAKDSLTPLKVAML